MQGVADVGNRSFQQLVATYGTHCTRDRHLLLLTISDDHHFVQILKVGNQRHIQSTSSRLHHLCLIAQVRELQCGTLLHRWKNIMTVKISHCTRALTLYQDGDTHECFSRLVFNSTFHPQLGKRYIWYEA